MHDVICETFCPIPLVVKGIKQNVNLPTVVNQQNSESLSSNQKVTLGIQGSAFKSSKKKTLLQVRTKSRHGYLMEDGSTE